MKTDCKRVHLFICLIESAVHDADAQPPPPVKLMRDSTYRGLLESMEVAVHEANTAPAGTIALIIPEVMLFKTDSNSSAPN